MTRKVLVNGKEVRPGRKFKLETIMSKKQIEDMLLAGKKAGEKHAKNIRMERRRNVGLDKKPAE